MKTRTLLIPSCLSALIYFSSCASLQVGGDVQAGRRALQSGHSNDAVGYLIRAAEIDSRYRIPYRIPVGVLTYLGRAYYETGRDKEARTTLEKAVSIHPDDALAHLYLGLTLLRTGDGDRGRKEIEDGLKNIHETIEFIAADPIQGLAWDSGRAIRLDIENALSNKSDNKELVISAQRIGKEFDEEIDRARRDESARRGGGDSGGS
jgi:tetratricopeptide (TPR) repeat protein